MSLRTIAPSAALLLLLLAAPAAQAHPAWGIVVDRQGQVIFSEVVSNSVWRIGPGGELERLVSGRHSHAIGWDGQGRLRGEHVAYEPATAHWSKSYWTLDPAGRLTESAPPGNTLETIADGFATGQGRAWAPDGAIWVVDGARLRRIAPGGQVSTVGGDPLGGVGHGEHPRLLGVALRPNGSALVADYDHHSIREVGPDGRVSVFFQSGLLWSPSGVATAGGAVYVLESRPERASAPLEALGPAVRVRKIGADCAVETLAVVGGSWVARAVVAGLAAVVVLLVILIVRRQAQRPPPQGSTDKAVVS